MFINTVGWFFSKVTQDLCNIIHNAVAFLLVHHLLPSAEAAVMVNASLSLAPTSNLSQKEGVWRIIRLPLEKKNSAIPSCSSLYFYAFWGVISKLECEYQCLWCVCVCLRANYMYLCSETTLVKLLFDTLYTV